MDVRYQMNPPPMFRFGQSRAQNNPHRTADYRPKDTRRISGQLTASRLAAKGSSSHPLLRPSNRHQQQEHYQPHPQYQQQQQPSKQRERQVAVKTESTIRPLWQVQDAIQSEFRTKSKRPYISGGGQRQATNRVGSRMIDDTPLVEILPQWRLRIDGVLQDDSDSDEEGGPTPIKGKGKEREDLGGQTRDVPRLRDGDTEKVYKQMAVKGRRRTGVKQSSETPTANQVVLDAEEQEMEDDRIPPSPPGDSTDEERGTDIPHNIIPNFPQTPSRPRPRTQTPSVELIEAIQAISLDSTRRHQTGTLPFLPRNLRKSFLRKCASSPVSIGPATQPNLVLVVYSVSRSRTASFGFGFSQREEEEHCERMKSWKCPLCTLFGIFPSRWLLKVHLESYHSEATVKWEDFGGGVWQINVAVPEVEKEPVTPRSVSKALTHVKMEDSTTSVSSVVTNQSRTSESTMRTSLPPEEEEKPIVRLSPHTVRSRSTTSRSLNSSFEPSHTPFRMPKTETPPHSPLLRANEMLETGLKATSIDVSTPVDPLGPAARYPFLPVRSHDGSIITYSCNPDGPRIYDLLMALSMEPFGVLAWAVLDKEAKIFAARDVDDVDKVMQALWARWIFLNRRRFVQSYFEGFKNFLDAYHYMIYLAAGRRALMCWLMMLAANRFFDGRQVVKLLEHYDKLARDNKTIPNPLAP